MKTLNPFVICLIVFGLFLSIEAKSSDDDSIAFEIKYTNLTPVCDGVIDENDPWKEDNWLKLNGTTHKTHFQFLHNDSSLFLAIKVEYPQHLSYTSLFLSMDTSLTSFGQFMDGAWIFNTLSYYDENLDFTPGYHWGIMDGEEGSTRDLRTLVNDERYKFGTSDSGTKCIQEFTFPKEVLTNGGNFDGEHIRFDLQTYEGGIVNYWSDNQERSGPSMMFTDLVKLVPDIVTSAPRTNKNTKAYSFVKDHQLYIKNTNGLIQIYSIQGQKVKSAQVEENSAINISGLKPGIYIVKGKNLNNRFVK